MKLPGGIYYKKSKVCGSFGRCVIFMISVFSLVPTWCVVRKVFRQKSLRNTQYALRTLPARGLNL
jgi:hypothetical protein